MPTADGKARSLRDQTLGARVVRVGARRPATTGRGRACTDAGAASGGVGGATHGSARREGASGVSTANVSVPTRQEAVALIEKRSRPCDVVLFENDLPDHYP